MSDWDLDRAWTLLLAAAAQAEEAARANQPAAFTLKNDGQLLASAPGTARAQLAWRPEVGWEAALPVDDPHRAFLELYLPICSATMARPVTVGHLGQSLDGFIATHSGESRWVT